MHEVINLFDFYTEYQTIMIGLGILVLFGGFLLFIMLDRVLEDRKFNELIVALDKHQDTAQIINVLHLKALQRRLGTRTILALMALYREEDA